MRNSSHKLDCLHISNGNVCLGLLGQNIGQTMVSHALWAYFWLFQGKSNAWACMCVWVCWLGQCTSHDWKNWAFYSSRGWTISIEGINDIDTGCFSSQEAERLSWRRVIKRPWSTRHASHLVLQIHETVIIQQRLRLLTDDTASGLRRLITPGYGYVSVFEEKSL